MRSERVVLKNHSDHCQGQYSLRTADVFPVGGTTGNTSAVRRLGSEPLPSLYLSSSFASSLSSLAQITRKLHSIFC